MKLSPQSYSLVEQTLKTVLEVFSAGKERLAVTDIHIQPRYDSGELIIYNDDDDELARAVIEEWAENEYMDEQFYAETKTLFCELLRKWQEAGVLENLSVMKPYSFVLVDDEKETIAELLLVDDDTMLLSEELLEGLDKELNDFLKKLLEE